MPVITFDLDSTLCDTRGRQARHEIGPDTDWVAYALDASDDPPVPGALALVHALQPLYDIWIVTARAAEARELTVRWLERHDVDFRGLVMCDGELPVAMHPAFKLKALQTIELLDGPVLFHVDDWPAVAEELAGAGYACLTVAAPGLVGHVPA